MKQDSLIQLIHSLSKSEKREFKKQYPNGGEFIILFNFLNKKKESSNEEIQNFFVQIKKNKEQKKQYTSGYISVIKSYLKEKIIDFLRNQATAKRPAYQTIIRSLNADVLIEKGLFELAQKELNLAKKKSKNALFPIEHLLVMRRESILSFYQNYNGYSFGDIVQRTEKRLDLARHLLLETHYARMLSIIGAGRVYNEKLDAFLADFSKFIKNKPTSFSFANTYLEHWVNGLIAEENNDPKKVIFHFEKATQIWLENPEFIEVYPRMYLGMCDTYLKVLIKYAAPNSEVFHVKDLEFLMQKLTKLNLSVDEIISYQQIILQFKFWKQIKEEDFSGIVDDLGILKNIFEKENTITDYNKIRLHYFAGLALAKERRYDEALDWLSPFFIDKDLRLSANPELKFKFIILFFIVHFGMKNYQFLKYAIKNQIEYLKRKKQWTSLIQFFGERLRDVVKLYDKGGNDSKIQKLLNEIREGELTLLEKNEGVFEFSIANWMKELIEAK